MMLNGSTPRARQSGFTLVEVTIAMVLMGLLLGAFSTAASAAAKAREQARRQAALTADASLAMQRMVTAVRESPGLMLPLGEDPATGYSESVREQHVPPKPGEEDRTAVLAVRLAPGIDRNADGIADADNDGDGRVDEDPSDDITNDGESGIRDFDDDHDGSVDEGLAFLSKDDDDEDGPDNEDDLNGIDSDNDGSIDEDPSSDWNDDNAPGIAGVDDDGDGLVDEGSDSDDDEDGQSDEDWLDPVVFYLEGSELVERSAFPHDFTGNGSIDGRDFVEATLVERVSMFRVERIVAPRAILVDITLELSEPDGLSVRLNTRVRVGAAT
ncbi:MAG: prepilin-type N-terminal cleavage/methylation domain-containing protein [Gammaproteobacteria bacterium]|nr:prepilin-type N-terminal cleavage/methylation domain-containing protein [Gammaproteobacteria bacterium]NND60105.1 prepilin-type N-terminal cleavage/methylation domain-containing protein [Gammaproteobacteria bacterium]